MEAAAPLRVSQAARLYLQSCGAWLKTNLRQALFAALTSFVIGWVMNFALMAFVYDGWRMSVDGGQEPLATGQNNIVNGMFIWSLFSSLFVGLGFYWHAVGTSKFLADLAAFPQTVSQLFQRDGKAVWIHISWGAAISLIATYFVSRWVGLAVASVIVAAALSPLGFILTAMGTQLWRALMRDVGPLKKVRPTGIAGVMVGLFTTALVLCAGFFVVNPTLKLAFGIVAAGGAVFLSVWRGRQSLPLVVLLLQAGVMLLAPAVAWADDGGFAEAGNDFGTWLTSEGFGNLTTYATIGGAAAAAGSFVGAVVGGVGASMPPPAGGWLNALDPDGGEPVEEGGADAAPAEGDPEPVPADGETVDAQDGEAAAEYMETEEAAAAPEGQVQNPDMPFDPDNATEVIRAANAGNPEAIERLKEMKGENDPSLFQELLDLSGKAALGPVGSMIYDEIGGAETLKELLKLDWGEEVADTATAIAGSAVEYGADFVEGVANLGSFLWDKATETVEGAVELAQMDGDELVGMVGQVKDDIANSVVGQTVSETLNGIADLATMDRSEWLGLADQIYQQGTETHRAAVDALADRIIQGQQAIEGMTAEEALAHLGRAMGEAERYVDRAKQDFWRQDPDKVREALADATVAVAGEVVGELTGASAAKYGGKLLGALTHADEATDAVRLAGKADEVADAAKVEGAVVRQADDAAADIADAVPPGGAPRGTAATVDDAATTAAPSSAPDPDLDDWRGKPPETATPEPRTDAVEPSFDPDRTARLDRPDLPPERNRIAESMDEIESHDLDDAAAGRRPPSAPPADDPDLADWRGKPPETPASPPRADAPESSFDPDRTARLDRPDLPPERNRIAESMDEIEGHDLDDAAAGRRAADPSDGPAVDAPRTQRFDEPEMPADRSAGDGPARLDAETLDAPPRHPAERVDPGDDGLTVPPPREGPGKVGDRTPPDAPARPGEPDRDHPMYRDDVEAMPALEGPELANQTITARTVTGHDADGLPIPHPHDTVTIDIGDKLSNGSFNDVYFNRQSYFADEMGEGAKDTLVRVSKPIPDPPVMRPGMDPEAFAVAERKYQAQLQSLRGDQIGREALAKVAGASENVAAPKVLGRFEVLDEVRDASGNVVDRSRRVAEVIENVTDGGKGTRALDVLGERSMNVEEAIAYDKAVRAFNEQGYVLTDTHAGNFTFIDLPDGAKKVGVFDPGGIFPVRGADPDIARQIQRQIQSPDPSVMRFDPKWSGALVSDTVRPQLLEHVDGAAIGVNLENFVFKPDIGRRNPLLGELFDADDADAAYRRMRQPSR